MFNQPPISSMPPVAATPSVAPSGASKAAKSGNSSIIKTVAIVLLTLLVIGAGLLAVYFYNEYRLAKTDVDSQIDKAILVNEKEITTKLEAEFAEREKSPFRTFTGPSDYGSVSFKYPKTWSAYVDKDASKGGNFEAYLNPAEVNPVDDNSSIHALRLIIDTNSFESVTGRYKNNVEQGKTTSSVISVNGTDATRYDGVLQRDVVGSAVIFKLRDKTVIFQTDAEIYKEDLDNILKTITFNE